jgi:hypothetical protein
MRPADKAGTPSLASPTTGHREPVMTRALGSRTFPGQQADTSTDD